MDVCKPYTYILEIIRAGSVSEAAENLRISQPALSKYIKKIESEIGTELFDRSTVPLSLTEAGECYVRAAKKMLDVNAQMQKQMEEIRMGKNAEIRVGISPSRAPYLLPEILKRFDCTRTRVTVIEADTAELNELLSDGKMDLMISIRNDQTADFAQVHLFDEDVLLAVPENVKAENFEEAVKKCPIIVSGQGQPMGELLNTLCEEVGEIRSSVVCRNMVSALAMTEAGIGGTLVPSYMRDFGSVQPGVRFLPLPERLQSAKREVCVFYRKRQYVSKAEESFITCALAAAGANEPMN